MDKKPLIQKGWIRVLTFLFCGLVLSGISAILPEFLFYGKWMGNPDKQPTTTYGLLQMYLVNQSGLFLTVWLFRKYIDKQSFFSLGFQWKGYRKHAWAGFFAAIFILVTGTIILAATKHIGFSSTATDYNNILLAILRCLIVSFVEETVIRGYILQNLMSDMGKWAALIITSLLFALLHAANPAISILPLFNLFTAGLLLGVNFIYTKNLWFGIFMHFAWNFFQGFVLGYRVSGMEIQKSLLQQNIQGSAILTGGSFGFEGSVVATALIISVFFFFVWLYKKK